MLIFVTLSVGYFAIAGSFLKSDRPAFAAPVTGISMPAVTTNTTQADTSVVRSGAKPRTPPKEVSALGVRPTEAVGIIVAPAPSPTPTQAAPEEQEEALNRQEATEEETPLQLPLYQVYQASDGDSVYSIAERFGILPDYVQANNAELAAGGFLSVGQSIIIPAGNGILHDIRAGETLSDIADRYAVPVGTIVDFGPNGITDPNNVLEQQTVFVPEAQILAAAPFSEEPAPEDVATGDGGTDDGSGGDAAAEDPGIVGGGPSSSAGLIWPMPGPVSSYYGPGHPLGIDIDGFNFAGGAVAAATEGTVAFAGGNACCSYGLYVVIVSPSGIETLYAHLDSIYVSQGEYVSQGQALGAVGSSGYSTGTHLHFEVIDNGVRQDPLAYLP